MEWNMIKQFTLGFSRTINLGNYESARVEASITKEVNEEKIPNYVLDETQRELRDLLEETWKKQTKKAET